MPRKKGYKKKRPIIQIADVNRRKFKIGGKWYSEAQAQKILAKHHGWD